MHSCYKKKKNLAAIKVGYTRLLKSSAGQSTCVLVVVVVVVCDSTPLAGNNISSLGAIKNKKNSWTNFRTSINLALFLVILLI